VPAVPLSIAAAPPAPGPPDPVCPVDLLDLDPALNELAALNPRQAEIIELR
jgi:hypothetical protein